MNDVNNSGQQKPGSILPKIIIVAVLALIVVLVLLLKCEKGPEPQKEQPASTTPAAVDAQEKALPRLVELGSASCIPCKLMKPILDELEKDYAGSLEVEFIDLRVNPQANNKYNIRVMPTQVFLDASGKELFRHEGFFAKEDILAKWAELGVTLKKQEATD